MRVFHFCEQPYPDAWQPDRSLRVSLPSKFCDPQVMAGLYERYFDEWLLADELGFDLMVNEHHATATCVSAVAAVTLSILARQTKKARILTLGYPIANRLDPVRMAEELAMIDVISKGRLEIGFVRGVPYEIPLAVRPAVDMYERFWEAHDLILKALSTTDGPFDWQGKHFHYRNVNVWPRSYQDPHPPVWVTGRSPSNVREIAERGYTLGAFLSGYHTKSMFDVYRATRLELGLSPAQPDRFSYLGIVAVAQNKKEALARANIMLGYLRTSAQVAEPYADPPGYMSVPDAARAMRGKGKRTAGSRSGKAVDAYGGSVEDLIDAGLMFVGTPDDVFQQINDFSEGVGGLGNFLMMGQAGTLSHRDTVDNLTLFAEEVLPRLRNVATSSPQLLAAHRAESASSANGRN